MPKTIIVSNRLPVFVEARGGSWTLQLSPGGVATGLRSLPGAHEQVWIGWPGIPSDHLTDADKNKLSRQLAREHYHGIHLTQQQVDGYYHGFCNATIWPLFHYFTQFTSYDKALWQIYQEVNRQFCAAVLEKMSPDDTIWVHDYQLLLVPEMIREQMPDARIGFFLHIPFPSFEIYRLLPWRSEILRGMLGADLVGFHTYDYVRHFLSSTSKLTGMEHSLSRLTMGSRMVKVDAFPMGIDYEKYSSGPTTSAVRQEMEAVAKAAAGCKLMVSIDRLDYTKGIPQRVEAFDAFLSEYPQYRGKVKLLLLAVPTRTDVPDYAALREQVERLIAKVNGQYATIEWEPIRYLFRAVPFEQLCAFYASADIALVTPLRDGMNLIAKEFIAARADESGVLILSEMAGAASELGEALIVNSNDQHEVVEAMKKAIEMPLEEQRARNRAMQRRLKRYDIFRWANDFMQSLADTIEASKSLQTVRFSKTEMEGLKEAYVRGRRRLFLLDCDGTVPTFAGEAGKAAADRELLGVLGQLASDRRNSVVLVSGRDRDTLERWVGAGLDAGLIAEHGAWQRLWGGPWRVAEGARNDWKETVKALLDLYADRTPGTVVEEKDFSLVWHYLKAEPGLAQTRLAELRAALMHLAQNQNLGILDGNHSLEVRSASVNKATAAQGIVSQGGWDFILAAGDDYTDKDMFRALPAWAHSLMMGYEGSGARFSAGGIRQLRDILGELARCENVSTA